MSERLTYNLEYELKASPKVLFPFLLSPSGLQQWFADKVSVKSAHEYQFSFDGETHSAELVAQKTNRMVRFKFAKGSIELELEQSEMSQTTYLKVADSASKLDDAEDARELWDYLVDKLKEIVGS